MAKLNKQIQNITLKQWGKLVLVAVTHVAVTPIIGLGADVLDSSPIGPISKTLTETLKTGVALVLFHELEHAMVTEKDKEDDDEEEADTTQ